MSGHQLSVHGRLRGPRVLLSGDVPTAAGAESAVPRPDHSDPGQPREPADHPGVRVLRRVPAQVRVGERVALLHGGVRLPLALRAHRGEDLLRPRRPLALHHHPRPDPHHRPQAGDPPRRLHVRPHVVGPRGHRRVGAEPARGGLPLRGRHHVAVQPDQQDRSHRAGTPACHGGLQVHVQRAARHGVVSAQLLLPVRERGGHPRAGRAPQSLLQDLRRRPAGIAWSSCQEATSRLLPLNLGPARIVRTSAVGQRVRL
mmetsp:Transcript_48233/g.114775  ORF Transcript_48233/g.114775 Transcript_48233/m.114775 type:complete len:257 (-) Transcript_48233:24-794(-)